MWAVLGPLLVFVVVLLFQLGKQKENFATTTDASGNVLDASGVPVSATSSTIQLTLSDLLKLFTAATPTPPKAPAPSVSTSAIKDAIQDAIKPTIETPVQLYQKIRPSVLQDIKTQLQGAPFEPAAPIQASCDTSSDSMAQGVELLNAQADFANNADYIRKDSIPCYGCSL
jgi:hypothetical protein